MTSILTYASQLHCVYRTNRWVSRTHSVLLPRDKVSIVPVIESSRHVATTDLPSYRNMTIEEVSVLFDTGRKGDAQAAALTLHQGKDLELTEELNDDEAERQGKQNVMSHVETVGTK